MGCSFSEQERERVYSRANLERTIATIRKADADIIGICEILDGQEDGFREKLRKLGYDYIFFGDGHETKYNKLRIKVAIASKIECMKKEIKGFPHFDEFGGGGGFLYCYVPKLKTDVFCLHFAIQKIFDKVFCLSKSVAEVGPDLQINKKKELIDKQIEFLFRNLNKNRKTIILGDFNMPCQKLIKEHPEFSSLNLVSNEMKNCSLTPVLKWFHYRDDDHIFVSGLKARKIGALDGYSDHKLIYADL